MRRVLYGLISGSLWLSSIGIGWADQTVQAKVQNQLESWETQEYVAVPFTKTDVVALVTIVGMEAAAANITSPLIVQGFAPVALIAWGAWRTNQYRPADRMIQIRTLVASRPPSHPGGYPGF